MADSISADEVARHATPDDCWLVVDGTVWDLTEFAPTHPGGADVIYTHAGRDATSTYNDFHDPGLLAATLPLACKIGPLDPSTVSAAATPQQQGPPERVKPPLSDLINLHDFEAAFAVEGSAKTQAYIGGAANDELTLRANLDHWARLSFRPRVLRDVSRVATRSTMLGCDARSPVFIAPMGLGRTGGPEAEAALARGAQAAGLVHCVSTMASLSLSETLSAAPGHPFWFQLYVDRDRGKTEALLRQVRDLPQVRAVLFTVDLPVVSKREADERVCNAAANTAGSFASGITGQRGADDAKGGGLARSTGSFIDSTLTWADVPWVRRHAGGLPVLAKGIQSAADARLALRAGCDGIVVSNHGGRALDGAPSSVLVLLELRRDCPEVFTRMQVYVDGGVRRGSDVLKAVCLGARGVGVGRPFQYAISYGTEGVQQCANILQDELETAMRLCGVTDLNKVRGDMTFLNVSELEALLPPRKEKYPRLGSAWSRLWAKL